MFISAPVVFILLPDKSKNSYYRAFRGIKIKMEELGLPPTLLAKWVMSDFEENIKKQFLRVWPGMSWRHCLFHYVKAVMRQVKSSHTHFLFLRILIPFLYFERLLSME